MKSNGNGAGLEHRTLPELLALKTDIESAIANKREAERKIRQDLIDLAQSRGFDAKEVLGLKGGRPAKAAGSAFKTHKRAKPAKYRDPSDPTRSWSGFGKTPNWLIDLTKGGKSREAYRV